MIDLIIYAIPAFVLLLVLIAWDRIFGAFQGETERPRYGLELSRPAS
jgi:hypothetical protein